MLDVKRLRVFAAIARHGSVTAAAEELHYAQPSVSHHLARLEEEVGLPLVQRTGRGIRLTEVGRLLADRAEEILGRLSSTQDELDAHAGLRAGRVRLAAFPSALATLVPSAAARLRAEHPGLAVALTEAEPPEALAALRAGEVDVALVFRHEGTEPLDRFHHVHPLLTEPVYLISLAGGTVAGHRDDTWIAGCPRCRAHLLDTCDRAGFQPSIAFETDDYVAVQALVSAGMGVALLPGLALLAHRRAEVRADRVATQGRHVLALTYGEPPVPPAVHALVAALTVTVEDVPPWP